MRRVPFCWLVSVDAAVLVYRAATEMSQTHNSSIVSDRKRARYRPVGTYLENGQHAIPQIIPIALDHIMESDQQTVIHDAHFLQELRVGPQLLLEKRPLLRSEIERPPTVDPVEVLQDGSRVCSGLFFGILSADRRSLARQSVQHQRKQAD